MTDRIVAIDVLRGFALLGILIMNIMMFAYPSAAYFNPQAYKLSALDLPIYAISHVLADQKFMALFSLLFGASTLLFLESARKKGKKATRLFYIRNFWLLVIGLTHQYLIWIGDILTVYALCSFVLYFFSKVPVRVKLVLGVIIYLLPSALNAFFYVTALDGLSPAEQSALSINWSPGPAEIQQEINGHNSSYLEQVAYRIQKLEGEAATNAGDDLYGLMFMADFFGRAFGMMLIGMALFSQKILNNQKSKTYYLNMVKYGFGIGIPISVIGLVLLQQAEWHWQYGLFLGRIPNSIATPFVAAGYIGLIMLWTRTTMWSGLQDRLKAIGKTALTCYLLESVLGTAFFNGLGLYGELHRGWQVLITLAIWAFMLLLAPVWLKKFQYGPVEWVWRVLTYFKRVPLRKKA